MIQHIDCNKRVEQMTYDPDQVAQVKAVIEQVGERRFMAYRLLRLENRSQREAARLMNCHRRSVERWAQHVEQVVNELRRKHRAA